MGGGANIKNCRIIVKDMKHGKVVADTYILGYDWKTNIVRVSATSLKGQECSELSVLIFGKDGFYEYLGKVERTSVGNETVIGLYSGQERKGRSSRRYEFHADGDITQIKIENTFITLSIPIEFHALNISATGILFSTYKGSFHKYDRIRIRMPLKDKVLEMECKVVRIENSTDWEEKYGCKIMKVHTEAERQVKGDE